MFHGRFQPFHNGHLKVCLEILKNHEQIIIAIANPTRKYPSELIDETPEDIASEINEHRRPKNNPWSYWQRYKMIKGSLIKAGVNPEKINIIPRFAPYDKLPFNWDNILPKKEDVVIYLSMKDKHHDIQKELYTKEGWEVKELPNMNFDISATEVRERIKNKENWEELVPEATRDVIKN